MPRRFAAVPLPRNVFRIRRPSGKIQFYWQKRRSRPDHGPLVKIPHEPDETAFWQMAERLNKGESEAAHKEGSFSALVAHYRAGARYKALSDNSKDSYESCLSRIVEAWGGLPVIDLKPRNIYRLLDQYADRPAMGNLIVRILRTLLKEGIRAGYTQENVAREIERLDEVVDGSCPWSEDTYSTVLASAPTLLLRAAVLARATGQRASDLVKLRPADRHRNGIRLTVKKIGGEPHWVPLHPDAIATIDGWNAPPMLPYLMHNGRRVSEDYLQYLWREWRNQNPIPKDATLHDLRAMAVCDRRLAGVPHQQIVDQLCMSAQMVSRYSKYIDREANAQAGMERFERAENVGLKPIRPSVKPDS